MRIYAKLFAVVVLVAGCGSPVDVPPPPMAISVGVVVVSSGFSKPTGRWECEYILTAIASGGEPGDFATWDDVVIRVVDRDGLFVVIIRNTSVEKLWGVDRISTGELQSVDRWVTSASAFDFDLDYVFTLTLPDGEVRESAAVVVC